MIVLGLDPGYRTSAFVVYDGKKPCRAVEDTNEEILMALQQYDPHGISLVVEQMQVFTSNYGVGQEVFDSVFWSGRFVQAWHPRHWDRLLRSKIRGHLGAAKGGDAAVRAALIARFGPYKEQAIGVKKTPGPLYEIKGHMWSALAVAVTYHDLHDGELRPGVIGEF